MSRHDGIDVHGGSLALTRRTDTEVARTGQSTDVVTMPADVRETLITCWAEMLLAEIENSPENSGDSAGHGGVPLGNRP